VEDRAKRRNLGSKIFLHRLGKFFRSVVEINTAISTSIDCVDDVKSSIKSGSDPDSIEFKYRDKIVIIQAPFRKHKCHFVFVTYCQNYNDVYVDLNLKRKKPLTISTVIILQYFYFNVPFISMFRIRLAGTGSSRSSRRLPPSIRPRDVAGSLNDLWSVPVYFRHLVEFRNPAYHECCPVSREASRSIERSVEDKQEIRKGIVCLDCMFCIGRYPSR